MNNLLFTLVERGFGWNFIRNIFAWLDNVAYTMFSWVMGLMFDIVQVSTDSSLSGFYGEIQQRIYVILTIYMLFKVMISFVSYVINPDSMSDKNQGVGNLVTRIIVSLVMLIGFPIAFNTLLDIQNDIILDGTVQRIVLGSAGVADMEDVGEDIGLSVYNGVFFTEGNNHDPISSIEGEPDISIAVLADHVNDQEEGNPSSYKYSYVPLVGFAVGIFLTLLVLSMCVDVAVRVFKLIILQLVAPIPIISYVDPKASKDGAFSKWLKLLISVYTELFIRLFIMYFIVLVIEKVINGSASIGGNFLVKLALIIGLLFFAKDAPKFICEAIGIKPPEKGLFGGLGNIMAAGALGLGALGAGFAVGASNLTKPVNPNHKILGMGKNIGSALFGGIGATVGSASTGIWAAGNAKDHQTKAVMDARNKYLANKLSGNTLGARMSTGAKNLIAGYDIDREISKYGAIEASAKKLRGYANGEGAKFYSDVGFDLKDADGHVIGNASKNEIERAISDASMNGGNAIIRDASGREVLNLGAASGSLAKKLLGDAEEFVGDTYMNELQSGGFETRFGATKAKTAKQILGSLTGSYADAVGITAKEASKHRNSQIKVSEKSAGNKGFILKQKKGGK